MLNITNYWRNANRNRNEIISHSLGYYLKNKTNIADDVKKWKILYLVGQNVNKWYRHYEKQYSSYLKKLKIELP